jgi:(3S)-malyl-CoA thioesterase
MIAALGQQSAKTGLTKRAATDFLHCSRLLLMRNVSAMPVGARLLLGDPMKSANPVRSMLYIPASKGRALEKAATLAADAIIFDLEDAVALDEKVAARAMLGAVLAEIDYGRRLRLVRINGLDTASGREDALAFATHAAVDGILVPKVNGAADLAAVALLAPDKPLWAMMETPLGILNAVQIAGFGALRGLVIGTNDLAKDLGARDRSDRAPLATSLGLCLLAAKAHGRLIVDGVFNAFRDEAGLEAECLQGRDMGFDGKTLIHPDQVAVANRVFGPSPEELDLAQRQIAAYNAALANGQGVAVLDGKIVENLHILSAQALIAKARAIAAMQE